MAIITMEERNYLMESMENLLSEYDYKYTEDALDKIIDEWSRQKEVLIEAFKTHPNYIEGKFMIAFDADYERSIDPMASRNFWCWLRDTALPEAYNNDYYPQEVKDNMEPWELLEYNLYDFFRYLHNYAERCVRESTATYLNQICPTLHVHTGQKTSRVVNKLCHYLGLDKVDGYNREFAKYADSLSPMIIKRHTVLSINPLDYLTMSFGNSWASCHTIDKENKRRMPNNYSGCYSSGTISYMLDSSSMVLYTVDASYNGNEYWAEPKINRQMFHYGEEKLVQGRLYPQDNDNNGDVYTPYRNIVQQIVSTIFNFPNLWTLSKGTSSAGRYICSYGTHYRDYEFYDNCSLSRVKGSENDDFMIVGAAPICVNCGERHHNADNINCCKKLRCADCGEPVDEDNAYFVDGEYYCRDCVRYCERCDEYHRDEETYVDGYGYVCNSCLHEYFVYCECCNTWVREDDSVYIDCEDRYVCDHCCSRYYTYCEDCGSYFPDEDMHTYGDRQLCEDCYDARMENENNIEDEEVC